MFRRASVALGIIAEPSLASAAHALAAGEEDEAWGPLEHADVDLNLDLGDDDYGVARGAGASGIIHDAELRSLGVIPGKTCTPRRFWLDGGTVLPPRKSGSTGADDGRAAFGSANARSTASPAAASSSSCLRGSVVTAGPGASLDASSLKSTGAADARSGTPGTVSRRPSVLGLGGTVGATDGAAAAGGVGLRRASFAPVRTRRPGARSTAITAAAAASLGELAEVGDEGDGSAAAEARLADSEAAPAASATVA